MKSLLLWVLAGAWIGLAAASVIVPPALSWYNEAGYVGRQSQVESMVNIPDVVRYTTTRLIRGQAIGGALGGFAGLVLGLVAASRRRRRTAPKAPPVETL